MVRRGLEKECRIPIESTSAWFVTHQSELGQLKMLVHTIITEGKVADSQGQIDRALDTYLDGLKFSYHAVRGGLGYDYLCGVSFKALFLKAIKDLVPKLTPEQSLRALHALDKLKLEQEPLKVIARRSKAWRRKTSGPGDLLNQLAAMVKTWSLNPELRNLMRASGTLEQQSNRLRTTLAHSAGASGEESPARRAD
jgi:hypothetical protein